MSGSIIVAVRSAVVEGFATHLAALDDFNGTTAPEHAVEVSYGWQFGSRTAERVFTGRASATTPPAAVRAGKNHKNESAQFEVTVLVEYVGGSPEDADSRALAIGEQFEDWIGVRKSNELGVEGLLSVAVVGWELTNLGNDSGSMTELVYTVAYHARIT